MRASATPIMTSMRCPMTSTPPDRLLPIAIHDGNVTASPFCASSCVSTMPGATNRAASSRLQRVATSANGAFVESTAAVVRARNTIVVNTEAGARISPRTSAAPRTGQVFSVASAVRSWRRSLRAICGPSSSVNAATNTHATARPSAVSPRPRDSTSAPTTRIGRIRSSITHENTRPMLIRFFQRIAISGRPCGARAKGVRLLARGCRRARMPPRRILSIFSESSADASSNGVSVCSTQR